MKVTREAEEVPPPTHPSPYPVTPTRPHLANWLRVREIEILLASCRGSSMRAGMGRHIVQDSCLTRGSVQRLLTYTPARPCHVRRKSCAIVFIRMGSTSSRSARRSVRNCGKRFKRPTTELQAQRAR
eukprot:scaffold261733_cov30-Tisochrysis_lutea.AAC.1